MSNYPYPPPMPEPNKPFNPSPIPFQNPTPDQVEKPLRRPGPAAATFCFLIVVVLFNGFALVSEYFLHLKSLWITFIGEISIVAVVPILFAAVRRYDLKAVFSIRRINFRTLLLCSLVGLAAQFAVRFPSFLSNYVLQIFGPLYLPNQLDDNTLYGKFVFVFVAAILAPLCEETLNRGFVMAGFGRLGYWRCILIVGLFFGLFHQYPYRLLDTTFAGVILAYLALTTGSIFASMAGHFGFNFLPSVLIFFTDWIDQIRRKNDPNFHTGDVTVQVVSGNEVVSSILFTLIGGALVFLLLRAVTRRTIRKRPGLIINYNGLAVDFVVNASTFENGTYFGPPDQPYRFSPQGFQPVTQPFPMRPDAASFISQEDRFKAAPRGVKIGWAVCALLIIALYCYTSFTEVVLRGRGRQYCIIHPDNCQPLAFSVNPDLQGLVIKYHKL